MKGIATLAIIPVRAQPSHQSELVSQLLFGETYTLLDKQAQWMYIRMDYDGYEGWLHEQQHMVYTDAVEENPAIVDLSMHNFVMKIGKETSLYLLPGSTLPGLHAEQFSIGEQDFLFMGMHLIPQQGNFASQIEETARFYLNVPYLWGGRSAYGIDCSGLTQLVYKHFNIDLPRDASQQAEQGEPVENLQAVKPGDLAFFDSGENRVTHVGIMLSQQEVIHAYGRVRIDKIDQQGILHSEPDIYSHNLRSIRRMV